MTRVGVRTSHIVIKMKRRLSLSSLVQQQHTETALVDKKLEVLESAQEHTYQRAENGWGLLYPDDGVMRVNCGDSVSDGVMRVNCGDSVSDGGGGTDPELQNMFWGPLGTRLRVECPTMCGRFSAATVWGFLSFMDASSHTQMSHFLRMHSVLQCVAVCCSVLQCVAAFMDASSICKTAILEGRIGYESWGYVYESGGSLSLELVEPKPMYGACTKNAVSEVPVPMDREVQRQTFTLLPYEWYEWDHAKHPDAIRQFGREGAIEHYRTNCQSADGSFSLNL